MLQSDVGHIARERRHWFSGEEGRLARATPAPTPKRCIHDERTGGAYHIHVHMQSDGGQLREDDLNITVRYVGVDKYELPTAEGQAARGPYMVDCF